MNDFQDLYKLNFLNRSKAFQERYANISYVSDFSKLKCPAEEIGDASGGQLGLRLGSAEIADLAGTRPS